MTRLIQSIKFKKSISFILAIVFFGFAIYFIIESPDYFLTVDYFVAIIILAFFIFEGIKTIKTTPKIEEELLDEDARWIKVCEHFIYSRFSIKNTIPILENKFTIERVNSNSKEDQYELWVDVLDFLSQIRYFGNTIDELKSKFTIKNK